MLEIVLLSHRSHAPFLYNNHYGCNRNWKILEKASVTITTRVLPRSGHIVVVPTCTVPGKLPRGRLCVDYRTVKKLLTPVTKGSSKVKGIQALVPLLKWWNLCPIKWFLYVLYLWLKKWLLPHSSFGGCEN